MAIRKEQTEIATLLINKGNSTDINNLFGHEAGSIIVTYAPTEAIGCLNSNKGINMNSKPTIFGNRSNAKELDNDNYLSMGQTTHNL